MARALLVGLVLLGACARVAEPEATGSPGTSPREEVILELRAAREAPTATLSIDGGSQSAAPATYCWGQRCVDAFGFPPPTAMLSIPSGSVLRITGDATGADIDITEPSPEEPEGNRPLPPGNTVQELRPASGADTIDVPPGEYWLVVFARWEGDGIVGGAGDATFALGLRVTG